MSVVTVCQQLSAFIGIRRPDAVMGSDEQDGRELAALVNEMGQQIAEAYPWQKLKRLNTITGDGSSVAFDVPSDFGWIPNNHHIRSTAFSGPSAYVCDHDEWLRLQVEGPLGLANNAWTALGGQIVFSTAPVLDDEYKHYYQSRLWAEDDQGDAQEGFTADEDTFRLDENLLRLGMLWKWKAYKGRPYAEEMATFERELNKRIFYDRPRNMIAYGGGRSLLDYYGGAYSASGEDTGTGGITYAFPYTIPFPVA